MSVLIAAQLSSLALLSIKLYESAYAISLGLFSGSCLLTGYLIFREHVRHAHAEGLRGVFVSVDLPADSGRRRNARALAADRRRKLRQMGSDRPHPDCLALWCDHRAARLKWLSKISNVIRAPRMVSWS